MAKLPDKLLKDVRKFLDSWQHISDKATHEADTLVYAIDLTAEYSCAPKEDIESKETSHNTASHKIACEMEECLLMTWGSVRWRELVRVWMHQLQA